ncbi:paraneoplastic antigen Ma1 homolog, partial [Tachysurus ichikawai]
MDEGKSMTDLQALFPSLGSSTSYPESIIRAVGEILEKAVKPQNDSNAYRRLRTFSGTVPTPAGEETMEHWIEQSRIMITEFLMPVPCSTWRHWKAHLDPLSLEKTCILLFYYYVSLLENPYLIFLRRMEKSLTKVVQRGGLSSANVDRARV